MCTVRGLHGEIMRMVGHIYVVPAGRVEPGRIGAATAGAMAGVSREQGAAEGLWRVEVGRDRHLHWGGEAGHHLCQQDAGVAAVG